MNSKTLPIPRDYEIISDILEKAKRDKLIFSLGDGLYGTIERIKYFKHANGIDSVVFKPIRNPRYYKEKELMGDDWVIDTNNYLEYCFGIPV